MSPDQYFVVVEGFEFFLSYNGQAKTFQPVNLQVIMHNVAQTKKMPVMVKFTFGNFYCMSHSEAKSGTGINGNLHLFLTS
jgi:hypothetical protein